MKRAIVRRVQCPCCGRGDRVDALLQRDVPHPGGIYDQTVWSEGKGNIQNEIVSVEDHKVTAELVRRCKAFLARHEEE